MAEDVVQEACVRAWNAWDDLREPARAKAWLMTIVRNEHARMRVQSRNESSLEEMDEGALPQAPSFTQGLDAGRIVAQLPPAYREPLLLQVLGGYSCAEIAGVLGTTEGAVMTRLSRARQTLRLQLREPRGRRVAP